MTKLSFLCLAILLIVALVLRTYRQDRLLGFYYDQGRDAKVIWDFWHFGNIFLVGPTTGIDGILLGPFYYFYIAIPYLLGNGNPMFPAFWLALTNVAAIAVMYLVARHYFSPRAGWLTAVITTFSLNQIQAHRWLANPTPLPLFSVLCVWLVLKIVNQASQVWLWPALGLALGLSLQLEAASATFFLPAVVLCFFLYRRDILFSWQKFALSMAGLVLTLVPQALFDLLHGHILSKTLANFLFAQKSFRPELSDLLVERLNFYFHVLVNKFAYDSPQTVAIVVLVLLGLVLVQKKLPSKNWSVILIWWLLPMVVLLFYYGNHGYIWDYYFTGAFPFFFLTVSGILAAASKSWYGKVVLGLFLAIFISQNFPRTYHYLIAGTDGPNHVTLGSSVDAVEWVISDAGSTPFNVDAYVPPVITHSYDYLFLWLGSTKYHALPKSELVPRLYTVFEQDPPHPERLQAWLARQSGIGVIETQQRFGGVTSQRRHRLP